MTRLSWSDLNDRFFETGLDRGVLYPHSAPAVPWNGLTGVDEEGADSATEFFMDGRPFLYLPKPKEFRATLKAFTFPDEFSEYMGVAEVVDGMYLDSQQSDSFGLSYRTLIGSATEETKAGYKIHLIYNATVAPQSVSHETLSDTVSPKEFSWEIQAVPMAITGRRATAHIVVDTRHLDETRLAELEATLYGSDSVTASLPAPQTIMDILAFGDAIVITASADGMTWTAEGSYQNVYLLDPNTFVINNVNAISNGDGTYTISSTP